MVREAVLVNCQSSVCCQHALPSGCHVPFATLEEFSSASRNTITITRAPRPKDESLDPVSAAFTLLHTTKASLVPPTSGSALWTGLGSRATIARSLSGYNLLLTGQFGDAFPDLHMQQPVKQSDRYCLHCLQSSIGQFLGLDNS